MVPNTRRKEIDLRHLMTVAILATTLTVPALADGVEFEVLERDVLKLAADRAKTMASRAIEAVMKVADKAKLVKVGPCVKGDRSVFKVGFQAGGGELEVVVDAASGEICKKQCERKNEGEAAEHEQVLKALGVAKITLTQVIKTALREVKGGVMLEAEAEIEREEQEYEVELLFSEGSQRGGA